MVETFRRNVSIASSQILRYNLDVSLGRARISFLRFAYRQFYNRFAFTYDVVSAIVSRGEWRAWTRAAIPFVRGKRVLEIAFGTGNLMLDLAEGGYAPVGIELSPFMIEITRGKLRRRGFAARLVRARVQRLPFATGCFDSAIMTFPPGFASDVHAMAELRRVLADDGRLIWVDAAYLYPRDAWSRFLNWAFRVIADSPAVSQHRRDGMTPLPRVGELLDSSYHPDGAQDAFLADGWAWRVEKIERPKGYVHVMIASQRTNGGNAGE